jgi:signal transduction histidine kinase
MRDFELMMAEPHGLADYLRLTADAVADLLGFEQALVSLRDGDEMVAVVVAGTHPPVGGVSLRPVEVGRREPVPSAERLIAMTGELGLTVIRHDHRHPDTSVTAVETDGELHGHFSIHAPLTGADGELLGMLSAITPDDVTRPSQAQIDLVHRHAALATEAVRLTLDHALHLHRLRLLDTGRSAVTRLDSAVDPGTQWPSALDDVRVAFGADDVLVQLFEPDGASQVASAGRPVRDTPAMWHLRSTLEREAAVLQEATAISLSELESAPVSSLMRSQVAELFARDGFETGIVAPLMAAGESFGALLITRRPGRDPWTELEIDGASTLAADLATLLHNRHTFERQRALAADLQAGEAYQDHLITTVTHTLRHPLVELEERVDLLSATPSTELADSVEELVSEMATTVEDLLTFSRLADPRRPLESAAVDVTAVARRVVDLVTPLAERDEIGRAHV